MEKARDYSPWIIFRVSLLVTLWILYALIPHLLSLGWLHLVSLALILYCAILYSKKQYTTLGLMVLALLLNNALLLYLSAKFNLFLTLIITLILLYDLVNAPQEL